MINYNIFLFILFIIFIIYYIYKNSSVDTILYPGESSYRENNWSIVCVQNKDQEFVDKNRKKIALGVGNSIKLPIGINERSDKYKGTIYCVKNK